MNKNLLAATVQPACAPTVLLKHIGLTTYQVSVYFSDTSKETINDKITRLIKKETERMVG